MLAVVIVEGVAIALLALLVVGLLRSHADILAALHELGAGLHGGRRSSLPLTTHANTATGSIRGGAHPPGDGRAASDLVGTDVDGEPVAIAVGGREHATLLAFLSSGCTTCLAFWRGLAGRVSVPGGARLVIVARDDTEESPSQLSELAASAGDTPVLLSTSAWRDYDVPGSPYFVLVDGATARVAGEGTGTSWSQVFSLLGQAQADAQATLRRNDRRADADPLDAELAAAGIGPGHPSLYGPAVPPAGASEGSPASSGDLASAAAPVGHRRDEPPAAHTNGGPRS